MTNSFRNAVTVGCGVLALAPVAVALPRPAAKHTVSGDRVTMGRVPASGASLLVTFVDVPTRAQVESRLDGLGSVSELVPAIGIWQLTPASAVDRAGIRGLVATRRGVARVEWALERSVSTLPPRRPAIPALPQIAVPTPTDAQFANQWSMQTSRWSASLTGRPERPIIAILDTGLDTTNPEWSARGLVVSPRDIKRSLNTAPDGGVEGHGTHVAGIAAAPIDGIGVVGVAPANTSTAMPGARVMPVKITFRDGFNEDVSTDATQMAGINWAVNHGAKVINISSGGPGFNQAYQDVVDWAMKRGTLVVASVGNDGQGQNDVNYPAGYDHVVGVGALCDGNVDGIDCVSPGGRATFSNFNFSVDVLAPGVNILSTLPMRLTDPSAPLGYGYMTGTSMASPYVTGAAALVYSSHRSVTPYQVLRLLESTADRGASRSVRTSKLGWGPLNPARAVSATAPINDLTEPNDDVNLLQKRFDIVLTNSHRVTTFTARADFNDDHMDVYAMPLKKGRRVRVTLTSTGSKLWGYAYRGGGRVSPDVMTEAQFRARVLGATKAATPGAKSFVFTAPVTGRHLIQIIAAQGGTGGEYRVKVQRLN